MGPMVLWVSTRSHRSIHHIFFLLLYHQRNSTYPIKLPTLFTLLYTKKSIYFRYVEISCFSYSTDVLTYRRMSYYEIFEARGKINMKGKEIFRWAESNKSRS